MEPVSIPRSPLKVSALCYGTMPWGTRVRGEAIDRLYSTFREAGGNFFDTAHCYCFWVEGGLGASERALGECVRKHRDRNAVIIATKGGHPAAGPAYPRPDSCLTPLVIASDIDESLERLGMDRIDLYWLHRDDRRVPVGEILDALNGEVRRGRIRFLGASNWTAARIAEANEYATRHGWQGFVASQPQWNLAEHNGFSDPTMRVLTEEDQRWHASSGVPVVPYSSTACGWFASNGECAAKSFNNATSRTRLGRVGQLAAQLGVTPNQVALAWLRHQPFPVMPILGTGDHDHLRDALGSVSIRLTPEQVRWLKG